MPVIFADIWDPDAKKWLEEEPPTIQDGYEALQEDMLTVNVDTEQGTLTLSFDHEDPETAKNFVEYFLLELSEALREEVIRDAAENMRFFQEQINKISDPLLREKIYTLLAREIEKDTFARAQKYYSFVLIDPPIVPDLNKKVKPKRSLICILSVFVAFFVAVFLAFLREYVHRLKTEDIERYKEVANGLKPWKRMRRM